MLNFLSQVEPVEPHFWAHPPVSAPFYAQTYFWWIIATLIVTSLILLFIAKVPSNYRRPIVVTITFVAGLFWLLEWIIPKSTTPEGKEVAFIFGYNYLDVVPVVSKLTQILTGFILGLGVLSIFRVHLRRLFKMSENWFYSGVLLISMMTMIFFGLWKHYRVDKPFDRGLIEEQEATRDISSQLYDIAFTDMWLQMDAAMFSLIAFFILSAAYRAFRIRSIEATIMMVTALIVLMGFIPLGLAVTNSFSPDTFTHNFRVETIGSWILSTVNTPAMRAIDLGLGLGILAMSLRILLGMEKGVSVD